MNVAVLASARKAHRDRAWADACARYAAADRIVELAGEDLERYAESAHMLGRDETIGVSQRLYRAYVASGEIAEAARCAYWLQDFLTMRGESAQAGGWVARVERLVASHPECGERGYLSVAAAERTARDGNPEAAYRLAGEAIALAGRSDDRDVVAIAVHLQGGARIKQGLVAEGLALLDEAMTALAAGEVSPRTAGYVYCSAIAVCQELFEPRRAREWTVALNAWCDARPQFTGGYSGICRVHRSALLTLNGVWPEAAREAGLACEQLTSGNGLVVAGMAFYQLAEVHRLRGELADAEAAYRRSGEFGWETQPGLALLRLAQVKLPAARTGVARALAEASDRLVRAALLAAHVEIMLAVGDLGEARDGATELEEIADGYGTAGLRAIAAQARGAVLMADGDFDGALSRLRQAWRLWCDMDAPYRAARCRELLGLTCRAMRDVDSAVSELEAARTEFRRLGAGADLARLDASTGVRKHPSGLSPRELEVLRLVAAGRSNQAIAAELFISEKTVARHVSNILAKLDVPSRTAAAAYAFAHDCA